MKTELCKDCGKKIVFAINDQGKWIPLDPVPPIYRVWLHPDNAELIKCRRDEPNQERELGVDRSTAMVAHFATCPKASEFSRTTNLKRGGR